MPNSFRDIGEGRFVTFVAVVCVPECPSVELLSAGHGPLFIYSLRQDCFEEIGAHGLPLGISSQFVSDPPKILELDAGDLLVLATDGLFEWTNRGGEQFGVQRVEETIREGKNGRLNSSRLFMKRSARFPQVQSNRMI